MVVDTNAKGSPFANRKNRSDKSRLHVLTNDTLDDLRWELRLIDKTIAAFTRLSRLDGKAVARSFGTVIEIYKFSDSWRKTNRQIKEVERIDAQGAGCRT